VRSRSAASGESGVSLIEIVLALGILTTVLMALGGIMFQVARHTQRSALASYRSAAASRAAAWALALPWDSISGAVGCATDSTGQLVYVRCATVQTLSPQMRTIQVVITPQGWEAGRPDTVLVTRTKRKPPSPLMLP
jgi:hypothetical protein